MTAEVGRDVVLVKQRKELTDEAVGRSMNADAKDGVVTCDEHVVGPEAEKTKETTDRV